MKIVAVLNGNQNFFNETDEPEGEECHHVSNFKIIPNLVEHYNLKERDDHFLQLQSLIEQKKDFLLKNQQKIKKINKQNEFLENVKNDYSHYNQYIVKQKTDQMKALDLLNQYIKDLTESGELSEQNIRDTKHEQRKILKEINFIKQSLDELIDGEKVENNTKINL